MYMPPAPPDITIHHNTSSSSYVIHHPSPSQESAHAHKHEITKIGDSNPLFNYKKGDKPNGEHILHVVARRVVFF